MGDGQVQVFGKILEGEKMTANGHGGTPESLGENEGIWEATCKYKLHVSGKSSACPAGESARMDT